MSPFRLGEYTFKALRGEFDDGTDASSNVQPAAFDTEYYTRPDTELALDGILLHFDRIATQGYSGDNFGSGSYSWCKLELFVHDGPNTSSPLLYSASGGGIRRLTHQLQATCV